jgi:hypothetical protein
VFGLSDYVAFVASLLSGFASLDYQSVELEELTDDSLPLITHVTCQQCISSPSLQNSPSKPATLLFPLSKAL